MTLNTNRNNIQPVLRFITVVVMVLLCLCGAVMTSQSVGAGQFATFNSIIYSICCLSVFRMDNFVSLSGNLSFFALTIFMSAFVLHRFTFFCSKISPNNLKTDCFTFFGLTITLIGSFAFFALPITHFGCFAFFCFLILFNSCKSGSFMFLIVDTYTKFALVLQTILCGVVFRKFRNQFDLLAMRAAFCLNVFRHSLFPYKRFMLEPYARPMRAFGLFYCIEGN